MQRDKENVKTWKPPRTIKFLVMMAGSRSRISYATKDEFNKDHEYNWEWHKMLELPFVSSLISVQLSNIDQ